MQDKLQKVGYEQSASKAKLGKNPENRTVGMMNSHAEEWYSHRQASVPVTQMNTCKMSTQLG